MRARRIAVVSILSLTAVLVFPHGAQAVGELAPGGCVDDNDTGPDVCALSVNGMDLASGVAVSPDGTSVYAVSADDDAIVRFNRSTTGALTSAGCIDDNDTGPDVCAQSVNALEGAVSVAVSPDGKSVYVVAEHDDALVRFNRSPSGALTPAGCIDDNTLGDDSCALGIPNLKDPKGVAVSPDGRSVYVVARTGNAVHIFDRDPSGALDNEGCFSDNDIPDTLCDMHANGLAAPDSVAVSPDGISVYVASEGDSAVARFNRAADGQLFPAGCVDDNDSGFDACAQSVNGLLSTVGVAVSPDGKSVYATSSSDDAIVRFNRSPTGALTPGGCIDDNDSGNDVCAQSANALAGAGAVTVSPDGASVYVQSRFDDAITRFNRSPTGALTRGGCINDNDTGTDTCDQAVNGMAQNDPGQIAVSPDGKSVYIVGPFDDAIVRFNRAI